MDRQTFSISDSWVLASLSGESTELWELIMAADVLNHAILKREEIVQGLIKPQHWGLATVGKNEFALTPRGNSIRSSISGGLFSIVENLQKKLNSNRTRLEWISKVNDCSFISESAVESAYEKYRAVSKSKEKEDGV